jgi:hypothetical protein
VKPFVFIAFFLSTLSQISEAQRRGGGGRFAEMEKKAIAEPFRGVTADGKVEEGTLQNSVDRSQNHRRERSCANLLKGLTA